MFVDNCLIPAFSATTTNTTYLYILYMEIRLA